MSGFGPGPRLVLCALALLPWQQNLPDAPKAKVPAQPKRTPPPTATARSAASTSPALQPTATVNEDGGVATGQPVAGSPPASAGPSPTAVRPPASLTHAPRPRKKRRR